MGLLDNFVIRLVFFVVLMIATWAFIDYVLGTFIFHTPFVLNPIHNLVIPATIGVL